MRAVHKIDDIVRLALHSLVVHMLRSALTALGIVIAVCSVIAMLAINEGFSLEAQKYLRELGSDNIIVESVKPPQTDSQASGSASGAYSYGLTKSDAAALRDNLPRQRCSAAVHRRQVNASAATHHIPVTVLATDPDIVRVTHMELAAGRFLTHADTLRQKPYCLITHELARRLFAYADPLGQTLRLDEQPFLVVGVLLRVPSALAAAGGAVIVPLSTDLKRFGPYTITRARGSRSYELVDFHQLILQMPAEQAVLDGARVARSLLERRHKQLDYKVTVPQELIEQKRKQRRLWNVMFLAIASISLVVGGIGIMNIMLASVTERTREIGVRRALGAKQRDIVSQFLVESVTLTTVGAIIGIAIGLAIPSLVEWALNLTTVVSATALMLPLGMAVAVGLVAGLYPALRAARLDPIVALRHE